MQEYGWATTKLIFNYTHSPDGVKISQKVFFGGGATFLTHTVVGDRGELISS